MRIAVLLSGGVDSSVALSLLHRQGHELEAFYLKIWLEEELAFLGHCPWEEDLEHARAVCEQLQVPLRVVPLQREYRQRVVDAALSELLAGNTPSPDLWCNEHIKYGAFFDAVHELPSGPPRWIASGHYARVEHSPKGTHLLRATDPVKDQTYFLSRLHPRQLARCLFPVGDYRKEQVREIAEELGLATAGRKDSQGLCFLGKIDYDAFVRSYLGEKPGPIRDAATGEQIGEHRGYWFHTIGQRRGLGLGGGPWYVVGKEVEQNALIVAHGEALDTHGQHRFTIAQPHWLGQEPELDTPARLEVKVRHTPRSTGCTVQRRAQGGLQVEMDEEELGLAPGQAAVLYQGARCLGGGTITMQAN